MDKASLTLPSEARAIILAALVSISDFSFRAISSKYFAKISKETEKECEQLYIDVIRQERDWAAYLFKDGSMIGLNEKLLSDYVDWIGAKRMRAIGLTCPFSVSKLNPLPWTEKWIGGGNVQPAPQETEISSYVVGGVKQDVDEKTISNLRL